MRPLVFLSVKERVARSEETLVICPGSVQQENSERENVHFGSEWDATVDLALPEGQHKEDAVLHDGRIALCSG